MAEVSVYQGKPLNSGISLFKSDFPSRGYVAIVDHGDDANVVRPSRQGPILWRGTVEPLNSLDGDDWLHYI